MKLGDYYYYGMGTTIDYETAASHYRLASDQQHNAQAMFNLGYMHEQGLGMAKDMHLAKRCYDLASETSENAKVPVALALFKLYIMFKVKNLQEVICCFFIFVYKMHCFQSPFSLLIDLNETLGPNWDLYLITMLAGILGFVVYFRRPQGQAQQQGA